MLNEEKIEVMMEELCAEIAGLLTRVEDKHGLRGETKLALAVFGDLVRMACHEDFDWDDIDTAALYGKILGNALGLKYAKELS